MRTDWRKKPAPHSLCIVNGWVAAQSKQFTVSVWPNLTGYVSWFTFALPKTVISLQIRSKQLRWDQKIRPSDQGDWSCISSRVCIPVYSADMVRIQSPRSTRELLTFDSSLVRTDPNDEFSSSPNNCIHTTCIDCIKHTVLPNIVLNAVERDWTTHIKQHLERTIEETVIV